MRAFVFALCIVAAHGAALDRYLVFTGASIWPDNNFKRIENVTHEQCAQQCIDGEFPGCASFRYKEEHRKCDLLAIAPDNRKNVLGRSTQGWDFYLLQRDLDLFLEIKGASLWPDENYLRVENVTQGQCAAQCLAGVFPGCASFRYKVEHQKCDLLTLVPDNTENVLTKSVHRWDFYMLRKDVDRYIEIKGASAWPDNNYRRLVNLAPEDCAEQCIDGVFPGCESFRYKEEHQKCDLLPFVPDDEENALVASTQGWNFYMVEPALDRFLMVDDAGMWPDDNFQRLENVTQEHCAQQCLSGAFPGCASFRYKVEHRKCDLLTIMPYNNVFVFSTSVHGWDFYLLRTAAGSQIRESVTDKESSVETTTLVYEAPTDPEYGKLERAEEKLDQQEQEISRLQKSLAQKSEELASGKIENQENVRKMEEVTSSLTACMATVDSQNKSLNSLRDELLALKSAEDDTNARPRHCMEIYENGQKEAGVYTIYPFGPQGEPVNVFCTDGWTVFQKRDDEQKIPEDFDRNWEEYKKGFGTPGQEFWLGLDALHALTNAEKCQLKVEVMYTRGSPLTALYNRFSVGPESEHYKLGVGSRSGGQLSDYLSYSNGRPFSTPDANHMQSHYCSYSKRLQGGWWFRYLSWPSCRSVNLNAPSRADITLTPYWTRQPCVWSRMAVKPAV